MSTSSWETSDLERLLDDFSPFDPRYRDLDLRYTVLDHARNNCPVRRSSALGGFWLITGYDEAKRVLADTATFSSTDGIVLTSRGARPPLPPIEIDPPTHREWRHLLNPYLSPAAIAAMEGEMRKIARELIHHFIDLGACEFMNDFAEPFPAFVIGRIILGIDDDDRLREIQRSNHRITRADSPEGIAEAFGDLHRHCADVVRERIRRPREDDIITGITRATIEGTPVTEGEAVAAVMLLHLGGLDTVSDALGSIAYRLTEVPGLATQVASPPWFQQNLDEFLRIDPPIQALARTSRTDAELGGVSIKAGDRVYVHYGSVNRDESEFPNGKNLDFEREHNRHMSFGRGPHRCLGSHLARLEILTAFDELLAQIDNIHIKEDAVVEWKHGSTLGPEDLPLAFTKRHRRHS